MEYKLTEFICDYPIENQGNWGWRGSLDDAISLTRMTFDLSPDKNNPLYYIVVMEKDEDNFVEYLIHHSGEYRGADATSFADDLVNSYLKDAG
jgi:hypothetical protein